MHNESNLILTITRLTRMKMMMTIGKDREPSQARLSLMRKSATKGANAEAHLLRAWDMMP